MKRVFVVMAFLLGVWCASAQTVDLPRSLRRADKGTDEKGKSGQNGPTFFFGGNVNSNFGQMLALDIEGGIYAQDWLRFGVGPRYELFFDGEVQHAFGATGYAEFIIANYLVGHLGYEFLNYPTYETDDNNYLIYDDNGHLIPCRKNIHALALGIGFQTQLTDIVGLQAQYLIYPIQSKNNHYATFLPMFARIGITVKLQK